MTTINENIKFEEQLWSYGRVRVQGLLGNLPPDTAAQSPPVEWAMWSTLTRYAAASGFALGALIGGRTAGLRFTAERSHQKPTSKSGWFLYHRQKNYTIALGGIKKGILFAGKFAGWMGCFYALDIALDIYDGRRVQWWHAPLAGISMGSLFSLVHRLPIASAKQTILIGAGVGFSTYLAELLSKHMEGRELCYGSKYDAEIWIPVYDKEEEEKSSSSSS